MKSNPYFYPWYYYTRAQKRGFIVLLLSVILLQTLLTAVEYYQPQMQREAKSTIDVGHPLQAEVDRLRAEIVKKRDTIYPFNPNYIDDYKGYFLELSLEEIDRLLAYRAEKKYVQSPRDFQRITAVSDAWLEKYSPYFVFHSPHSPPTKKGKPQSAVLTPKGQLPPLVVRDINRATQEQLQEIHGIGPALSKRIIEDRDRYGGYVHIDQLKFVYGLSDQVIQTLLKHYAVHTQPQLNQIDLNEAGVNELKNIPYLNYYLAREIVKYRSLHGDFVNKEQLKEIEKIPLDRIHIISLYLKIRN